MTEQEKLMKLYLSILIARITAKVSGLKAYYVEYLPDHIPSDFYHVCGLTPYELWVAQSEFALKGKEFVVYLSDRDLVYLTNCGAKFRLV